MIVLSSINSKDYDLENVYFIKLLWYEFFDINYLKYSNNFAADCIFIQVIISYSNYIKFCAISGEPRSTCSQISGEKGTTAPPFEH